MNRWPLQPLLDLGHTATSLARESKVGHGIIHAAATEGLTDWQADRVACGLGIHPALIWPGWADAGLSVLDRMFLETGWRQAWEYAENQRADAPGKQVAA